MQLRRHLLKDFNWLFSGMLACNHPTNNLQNPWLTKKIKTAKPAFTSCRRYWCSTRFVMFRPFICFIGYFAWYTLVIIEMLKTWSELRELQMFHFHTRRREVVDLRRDLSESGRYMWVGWIIVSSSGAELWSGLLVGGFFQRFHRWLRLMSCSGRLTQWVLELLSEWRAE